MTGPVWPNWKALNHQTRIRLDSSGLELEGNKAEDASANDKVIHRGSFMKPYLMLILCISIPPVILRADERALISSDPAHSTSVSVSLKYRVKTQPQTKVLVQTVLLPRSIPGRQSIRDIQYSTPPSLVFEKEGQRYAQFAFEKPAASFEFHIRVDADCYRYDLATASLKDSNRQMEKKEELQKWLIHERYLEKYAPEIQEATKGIQGKEEEETVRACFDYVVRNLKKRSYDARDFGAGWAIRQGKGDCTEFADLFVTLCRAKGIPARVCEGLLLEPVPDTAKHDWAEVYFSKYGWVPFDPFYAFLGKKTTFFDLRPIYLHLEIERQNPVLNNHRFWGFRYEGSGPVTIDDVIRIEKRNSNEKPVGPG